MKKINFTIYRYKRKTDPGTKIKQSKRPNSRKH